MKKWVGIIFILLPSLMFGITPGAELVENKNDLYKSIEEIADNYKYLYIRHEEHTMLDIKENFPAYAKKKTGYGPSFVYVKNENESVAFIFSNDDKIYYDPHTYFASDWKKWFKYYIQLGRSEEITSNMIEEHDPEYQTIDKLKNKIKSF